MELLIAAAIAVGVGSDELGKYTLIEGKNGHGP